VVEGQSELFYFTDIKNSKFASIANVN